MIRTEPVESGQRLPQDEGRRPLRVVHIVTAYPRAEGDIITPWLVRLIAEQRARGLEVSVLAPAYRGLDGNVVEGVSVRRFRYAPALLETLTHDETAPERISRVPLYAGLVPSYLAGGSRMARAIGRERPDVLHVHWPIPHALFGAAARRASGDRSALVCSFYSVEISWVDRRLQWLRPFLRWSIRTADAVTAISNATAARVRRLVPRDVAVVPFAAATTAVSGDVPPALGGDPPIRILFVGRLVERKGVEVLVEALALLGGRPEAELTIVGAGEWEPVIRRAVRDHHMERHVRFEGSVSDSRLRELYEECDLFVLPAVVDAKGDTEGLGVVLLEALSFERPVIASGIGGITDIVRQGKTGWLVPAGDAEALADSIRDVVSDPERARAIARAGRRDVQERFSWEHIVDQTLAVYEDAIRARAETR